MLYLKQFALWWPYPHLFPRSTHSRPAAARRCSVRPRQSWRPRRCRDRRPGPWGCAAAGYCWRHCPDPLLVSPRGPAVGVGGSTLSTSCLKMGHAIARQMRAPPRIPLDHPEGAWSDLWVAWNYGPSFDDFIGMLLLLKTCSLCLDAAPLASV